MNGMFNMQQPMMPTGIEGAIGQVSGGMGDDYTNRLLSALGLGGVSDYNIPAPMQMQQPMYNPYMYGGMFSPMMQQPMMQSPIGSFGENNYLDSNQFTFQESPFMRSLFQGLYNMPMSPVMNTIGGLGLQGYNRGSLAARSAAVRDSLGNDQQGGVSNPGGVTDSYSGGRDADGWGE